MHAFDDAIALHQVHAFERNVEAGIVGVTQEHELAAASVGLDQAEAFELADAVIDVDDEVSGFQVGEIAEEAGGANFAAGAIDGGGDVEEISVAEECKRGIGKGDAFGERRANEEQGGGFVRAFGSEAGGGIFGFAENVGDFVFAGNVGEAFEFAGASGGEKDFAAGGELRFDFAHARDHIAMKAGAGTGGKLELWRYAETEGELFEMDLRSLLKRRGELFFGPKIMGGGGRVGTAVAFVTCSGCG